MNWWKQILISTAIIVSFVGFSAKIHAQEAIAETAEAIEETEVNLTASVEPAVPSVAELSPEGVFPTIALKGDITEFLKILSKASQKNIIPSQQVRGMVEVNMFDVTFKEALEAVLRQSPDE